MYPTLVSRGEIFHELRGWLNMDAPMNMDAVVVTEDMSHELISSLKDVAPRNSSLISRTPVVFQLPMCPYVVSAVVRSLNHVFTAVKIESVLGLNAAEIRLRNNSKKAMILATPHIIYRNHTSQ